MQLKSFFSKAIKARASDIHLAGGEYPFLRIDGVLRPIEEKVLQDAELKKQIFAMLTHEQIQQYEKTHELDFSASIEGARFRINLHQERGNIGCAARLIPKEIPTPDELNFSEGIKELAHLHNGLVLITGPTGSGKSTTLASLIDIINQLKPLHIITIEDPIEFIIEGVRALIEQREVGVDTASFAEALKRALRQDPNVILIGEMRDPETITAALTAAETGHLVFSTLHTPTAAEAIERVIDIFSGDKQKQALVQLSSVLRAVVAQRLYPKIGGGRVAAREVLIVNNAVRNLIRENNIAQIKSAIQTGAKEGMVTMENTLKELVKEGLIEEKYIVQNA